MKVVNGCFQMMRLPKVAYEQERSKLFLKPAAPQIHNQQSCGSCSQLDFSLDISSDGSLESESDSSKSCEDSFFNLKGFNKVKFMKLGSSSVYSKSESCH